MRPSLIVQGIWAVRESLLIKDSLKINWILEIRGILKIRGSLEIKRISEIRKILDMSNKNSSRKLIKRRKDSVCSQTKSAISISTKMSRLN